MSYVLARRVRTAALLAAVFGAVALLNALDVYDLSDLVAREPVSFKRALLPEATRASLFFLLATPVLMAFYRKRPLARDRSRSTLLAYAAVVVVVSIAVLPIDYLLFNWALGTLPVPWRVVGPELLASYIIMAPFYLLTLSGILGTLALADAFRVLHERALAEARLRSEVAKARLSTLRSQLSPHFLCNTLNGVLPLLSHDPDAAVRALQELRELFRQSLEGEEGGSTLGGELDFLRRYLAIYERRFGPKLSARVACEEGVEDAYVPPLLLQPLVENAVHHGVATRSGQGHVEVGAVRKGDRLVLTVVDDGPGLPAGGPSSYGVGLANTRARLAGVFGVAHRLDFTRPDAGGLLVTVEIPFLTSEPATPWMAKAS
jgi:signal transduction histidine kinase